MPENCFHASIEGAQHGAKSLAQFLDYAKKSGASGAQPSNFMLQSDKGFKSCQRGQGRLCQGQAQPRRRFRPLSFLGAHHRLDEQLPSVRPLFIPPTRREKSPAEIEKWAEDQVFWLRLLDLCAELGVKIVPMFWGVAFGWELATGYPWGFWKGGDYDLLKEGQDRFVKKTAKIRKHARSLGIFLGHEIHPGTAAMSADDFNLLVEICDGDKCLAVNADPSHCWEGECWETRFLKVAPRIYACQCQKFLVIPPGPAVAPDGTQLAEARHAVRGHSLRCPQHVALR